MRFLFINPFYPLAEMPSPPLGIGYLAGALERAGIDVAVYDLVVGHYGPEKLEAIMAHLRPDVVGATSVTMTFHSAIRAVEDAKRIDPRVVTVLGGAHVTFCAEATLRQHPGLDVVAMGEGEEMIVELCDAVAGRRPWPSVRGLVWREGEALRSNGGRDGWIDVATLPPPARHLIPLARYRALGTPISMTTSRGCPFQCIFCVGRKLVGAKIRWRAPASVVDEMEHLASLGFPQVNLADDLFTARKEHAYGVCDEILRRGLTLTWTSFANVNTVDVPLLRRMREAGCVTVSFGLESANQQILRTVRKGTTVPRILEAVTMCRDAGMRAHGSFIVGLPGETPETIRESIDFSHRLGELGAETGFHMLAPFPGTAVREEAERYGVTILSTDWSEYHANHAITETAWADRETQEAVVAEIERVPAQRFAELAARITDGSASAEDRQAWASLERQGVFQDVIMHDVLERHGSWLSERAEISEDEAVAGITHRIADATGRPVDVVERAVRWGLEQRLLRHRTRHGVCHWEFADTPASLRVTEIVRTPPEFPAAPRRPAA